MISSRSVRWLNFHQAYGHCATFSDVKSHFHIMHHYLCILESSIGNVNTSSGLSNGFKKASLTDDIKHLIGCATGTFPFTPKIGLVYRRQEHRREYLYCTSDSSSSTYRKRKLTSGGSCRRSFRYRRSASRYSPKSFSLIRCTRCSSPRSASVFSMTSRAAR